MMIDSNQNDNTRTTPYLRIPFKGNTIEVYRDQADLEHEWQIHINGVHFKEYDHWILDSALRSAYRACDQRIPGAN